MHELVSDSDSEPSEFDVSSGDFTIVASSPEGRRPEEGGHGELSHHLPWPPWPNLLSFAPLCF